MYSSSNTSSSSDTYPISSLPVIDTLCERQQAIQDSRVNILLTGSQTDFEAEAEEVRVEDVLGGSFTAANFTDAECGEPIQSQFLRIDFTPVAGVDDNPELEKKCSDFWQVLNNQPQFQRLMVLPEKGYEEMVSVLVSSKNSSKNFDTSTPAVNWLKTGVGNELAFVTKHQVKDCCQLQSSEDYNMNETGYRKATRLSTKTEKQDTTLEIKKNNEQKSNKKSQSSKQEEKTSINSVRIDFTPNKADDENLSKSQKLLKLLAKKYDVRIKSVQVLPSETILADGNHHNDGGRNLNIIKGSTNTHYSSTSRYTKTESEVALGPLQPSRFQPSAAENRRSSTYYDAAEVCSQLDKWDKEHPKSMNPPGRVLKLSDTISQLFKQER